ncbi:hypothetical protein NQ315_003861, partial [Exocentrus adspersus]
HLAIHIFIVTSTTVALTHGGLSTNIKPVEFIKTDTNIGSSTKPSRTARSFGGFGIDLEFWTEATIPFVYDPQPNTIEFKLEENGHVTPDFSNGLDYPDPLLLTGPAAKKAAQYLYSKELFFSNIPHARAMLRNQQERHANGLAGNRLGSLREKSPFYRFRKQTRQNFL